MSRKLDARVAEIVMGLATQEEYDNLPGNLDAGYSIKLCRYSTDMNAAMEVVKHLANFEVAINECIYSKLWSATFEGKVDNSSSWEEKGDADHKVLPTAICLAALRAKGDDVWVNKYLKEIESE